MLIAQEDFLTVGKRQLEIEDEISAKCQKLVIIDSNLLTTCLVWFNII